MISASETYLMLGNAPLWETAKVCREVLGKAHVPFAIVGGVAVCLHGYRRNTVDLDLLVRSEDEPSIRQALLDVKFTWNAEQSEFLSSTGVPVQFLIAGERAGSGSEVLLPDPSNAQVVAELEGLPVIQLAKLIECKLACGEGNIRRTHRDFADVVELIAANRLDKSYVRFLHKSLRKLFKELVDRAGG